MGEHSKFFAPAGFYAIYQRALGALSVYRALGVLQGHTSMHHGNNTRH